MDLDILVGLFAPVMIFIYTQYPNKYDEIKYFISGAIALYVAFLLGKEVGRQTAIDAVIKEFSELDSTTGEVYL